MQKPEKKGEGKEGKRGGVKEGEMEGAAGNRYNSYKGIYVDVGKSTQTSCFDGFLGWLIFSSLPSFEVVLNVFEFMFNTYIYSATPLVRIHLLHTCLFEAVILV